MTSLTYSYRKVASGYITTLVNSPRVPRFCEEIKAFGKVAHSRSVAVVLSVANSVLVSVYTRVGWGVGVCLCGGVGVGGEGG